jgi:hypothetical protein
MPELMKTNRVRPFEARIAVSFLIRSQTRANLKTIQQVKVLAINDASIVVPK